MKILFKSDYNIFILENDKINIKGINQTNLDISNVKNLNDCSPLCELRGPLGEVYDIYHIHNKQAIIYSSEKDYNGFWLSRIFDGDILDYTRVNINKLLNGNII